MNVEAVLRSAGDRIEQLFLDRRFEIDQKGMQDWVSSADRQIEEMIVSELKKQDPKTSVLGEETGGKWKDPLWILDPIDGTQNFVRGIPLFAIALARVENGVVTQGYTYEPFARKFYRAIKGQGAYCNDKKIQVSQCNRLDQALVCLGNSFRRPKEEYLNRLQILLEGKAETRNLGSAALGLAYTAAGVFDGFIEGHLNPWDCLAGLLLVEEAGGRHGAFSCDESSLQGGFVVASNALLSDMIPQK